MGIMVPQKKLYDAFVQEEGVDGYRLNQTMKTYDQITQLRQGCQRAEFD